MYAMELPLIIQILICNSGIIQTEMYLIDTTLHDYASFKHTCMFPGTSPANRTGINTGPFQDLDPERARQLWMKPAVAAIHAKQLGEYTGFGCSRDDRSVAG